MLKIGDFSKISKVTIRTLRYYDQVDLFKPSTTDPTTGYRSYSIDQLPEINRIMFFKDMGFSLEEIRMMIQEHISPDEMKAMLSKRKQDIENEISMANINLHAVTQRLAQINQEGSLPLYDISIKSTEPMALACIHRLIPQIKDIGIHCYDMHSRLYRQLESMDIPHKHGEVTIYHNQDYTENDINLSVGILIDQDHIPDTSYNQEVQFTIIEAYPKVASLIYTGSLELMEEGFIELLKWIALHHYTVAGPAYEVHLSGPVHENNKKVASVVVELFIPIKD